LEFYKFVSKVCNRKGQPNPAIGVKVLPLRL
jgi:hypothetical protein